MSEPQDTYDPDQLLGTVEAAQAARRSPATVRTWARRGRLPVADRLSNGRPLYRRGDVMDAERLARERDDTDRAMAAVARHQPAHSA